MTATKRKGRPPHDDVLTPGEWRTVRAVQHGMTNREIAERRGISLDGVKFHVANAIAKLTLRNRKALRRWFGIPKNSSMSQQEDAVDTTLNLGPIGQISRSVKDIEQAEKWYGEVLGLPHLYTFDKLAFFDCAGTRLYLSETDDDPPPESVLYLRVEDIAAAHAELEKRGVEFVSAPHMIHRHADGTEEWMAFFNDLEGRPLAIMSQQRP